MKDAVADLRRREGCSTRDIARLDVTSARMPTNETATIFAWAQARQLDAVVWTALSSNFEREAMRPFSVQEALVYVQKLPPPAKAKAAEYVWRAPGFVNTPLRAALQQEPWFTRPEAR